MRLSDLKTGEKGVIVKVMGHGGFRKRIVEMGFIHGKEIEVLLNAPLQDPVKYKIMGYEISLRHDEAKMIEVVSDTEAAQAAQAVRPQQPVGQGQSRAEQITRKPDFADANKKTIAGADAARLQAEVRAAANSMQETEEQAIAKEMEQIRSLDELLENFSPKDGRQ